MANVSILKNAILVGASEERSYDSFPDDRVFIGHEEQRVQSSSRVYSSLQTGSWQGIRRQSKNESSVAAGLVGACFVRARAQSGIVNTFLEPRTPLST